MSKEGKGFLYTITNKQQIKGRVTPIDVEIYTS